MKTAVLLINRQIYSALIANFETHFDKSPKFHGQRHVNRASVMHVNTSDLVITII